MVTRTVKAPLDRKTKLGSILPNQFLIFIPRITVVKEYTSPKKIRTDETITYEGQVYPVAQIIPPHWLKINLTLASTPADLYDLLPATLHKVEDKKLFYSIKCGTKRNNNVYFPLSGFHKWYLFSQEDELCDNWDDHGNEVYLSVVEPLTYTVPSRLGDFPIKDGQSLYLAASDDADMVD